MGEMASLYLCGIISTAFALSLSSETMTQRKLVLVWLLMAALWPLTLLWIFLPERTRRP